MQIIQKAENDYDLTGLTMGKLLAILHALQSAQQIKKISPVGEDLLVFLTRSNLTGSGENNIL